MNALKADLKAWERDFVARNGRKPDKGDIKACPEIGARQPTSGPGMYADAV
jgi:hypothetical protein